MSTREPSADPPAGYDPSAFPAFAVTVDVLTFTIVDGDLHVVLVKRGLEPFRGMWAIPGGFKRPDESLEEAGRRELAEEAGVEGATLRQLGAYGDPGRDPRMNVVTVAYFSALPTVERVVAGDDAAHAALVRVSDALASTAELAFDHERILRDALERVRVDLGLTALATDFVGRTFTLAELRAVYEAVWDLRLDGANFRRSLLAEDGWVVPTGQRTRSGKSGGRPAALFRAGPRWKADSPLRHPSSSTRRTGRSL